MKKMIGLLLAVCLQLSGASFALADAPDLTGIKARDTFVYEDNTNSSWIYYQSVETTDPLSNTNVEFLTVDRGNSTEITDYPELRVFATTKAGKEIIIQSGSFMIDGNMFMLTFSELDLGNAHGAYFCMTDDAIPFMKSLAMAENVTVTLNHAGGTVYAFFDAAGIAGISQFAYDLLSMGFLSHISSSSARNEQLYKEKTPIRSYVFNEVDLSERAGNDQESAERVGLGTDTGSAGAGTSLREYTIPEGPFTVVLDEAKYNIITSGMSADDPAVLRSGIPSGMFETYMSLSNTSLIMTDINDALPAPFEIDIRVKDGKYDDLDLREYNAVYANLMLDTIYSSFGDTASGKEIVNINGVPYLKFSWLNGSELRYATIINGDMIYIWVNHDAGEVSDDEAALLLEVVKSVKYPD